MCSSRSSAAGDSAVELLSHPGGDVVVSPQLWETVTRAVGRSQAPATRRAYVSDWRRFSSWCAGEGLVSLPATPDTVAAYIADAAAAYRPDGQKAVSPATVARWVSTISFFHRAAGLAPPGKSQLVASTLSGIRRDYAQRGDRPVRRVDPLRTADVTRIVDTAHARARTWLQQASARRDAALLWLGFVGAFRRSELAGLTFADVRPHQADGLHVHMRRSKTDQAGRGQVKVIPYGAEPLRCPVCAYWRWHAVVCAFDRDGRAGVIRTVGQSGPFTAHVCTTTGTVEPDPQAPVFRSLRSSGHVSQAALSDRAVVRMIRRRAAAAGYTPGQVDQLGGHSLRAGFVTEAISNGASAHAIMRQTGHTDPAMVELYAREYAPAENNAVSDLGI